jgi:choline dehydrogenase
VIGSGAYDVGAFFKTSDAQEYADGFIIMNPLSLDLAAAGMTVADEPGFSAAAYLLHPTTESSVHISGSEPENPPVIEPRYLEHESEREGLMRGLEVMRGMSAQSPLADLIDVEQAPGQDVQTMEQMVEHAWASGHILHATGSVRMGPNEEDALDAELRVRGVENLRVVDTSSLPRQPGNTMAPTYALAWRAADLIRSDG